MCNQTGLERPRARGETDDRLKEIVQTSCNFPRRRVTSVSYTQRGNWARLNLVKVEPALGLCNFHEAETRVFSRGRSFFSQIDLLSRRIFREDFHDTSRPAETRAPSSFFSPPEQRGVSERNRTGIRTSRLSPSLTARGSYDFRKHQFRLLPPCAANYRTSSTADASCHREESHIVKVARAVSRPWSYPSAQTPSRGVSVHVYISQPHARCILRMRV